MFEREVPTMSESKLRDLSMDFSVQIINLVKELKAKHESVISNCIIRQRHQSRFIAQLSVPAGVLFWCLTYRNVLFGGF